MQRLKINSPNVLFLSMLGIGFFPYASGTLASIATIPLLYLLLKLNLSFYVFIPVFIFITIFAIYFSHQAQIKYEKHDPSWIVIDEFLGLMITYPFISKTSFFHVIIVFILFRFFDIIKIWPASYFDKKVTHGMGIILDDLVSGLMAGGVYWTATWVPWLSF
ncbi:MAG: hypothetical protein A2381_10685 [Bdellovibrionales bacterium RIFOXYB1_FULL_37_110]|nr:MAG: hypothetical protein A2181_06825 [Bdellovibrionales bacterium RIFOXYA1_FULL_38_20]OFZ51131.1 MAG: hypothetical protein A2417_17665 [Bdellovibrionales bacterium RIFOXYC1_FULL_37_79]OFZ52720.1 MAG: hypothetical protein A2328_08230 [Bdellovibrionales bacterium RIFOXYB2_FULL_36_6]OFZ61238.1 MAG: hypothetical protein A2381_10685 [Bdellovibrionales bacterium RIFOXYB1_FULL_37_110]OFZ62101.1 MAG: hypothetical protein A2577_14260 [Bdellovibrionales bacterium RIFOXYD1_FULL_36_51]